VILPDVLRTGLEARGFADDEKEGERLVLSRRASDQLKPSPPPDPPMLPCLTSLRACAPKLIRRANEGDGGGIIAAFVESSSSNTAGSSPKLFLNSGEPVPDEVDTLACRCLAKAVKGDDSGLPPVRPRPLAEVETDAPRVR